MKKVALTAFILSIEFTLSANLEKEKATRLWRDLEGVRWLRDGKEIISQTAYSQTGYSTCWIFPRKSEYALALHFKDQRIRAINSNLGKEGYKMRLNDHILDGIPETLEIIDWKTNKVVEIFTIINGIVEPVPRDFLSKDLIDPFSEASDKLMNYIKYKVERSEETNP